MDYRMADMTSEGVSIYKNFKIEYFLPRIMFSWSNMDFCMADLISEGVNEYILKGLMLILYGWSNIWKSQW